MWRDLIAPVATLASLLLVVIRIGESTLRFVEAMTRINKGRAFYTTPEEIGEYVMVDYADQKRRKIH